MPLKLKKIVITGPESTGKSTLCEQLAMHFNTMWVPEFARKYLIEIGRSYNYNDLITIAKGQLDEEDSIAASLNAPVLFIDTDMYVMKVWCEYVYNQCHPFILNEIVNRHYDGYLLCNTDLPWVKDELREYPDPKTRKHLYLMYKDLLVNQTTPWYDIHGDYDERLQRAIQSVEQLMINN